MIVLFRSFSKSKRRNVENTKRRGGRNTPASRIAFRQTLKKYFCTSVRHSPSVKVTLRPSRISNLKDSMTQYSNAQRLIDSKTQYSKTQRLKPQRLKDSKARKAKAAKRSRQFCPDASLVRSCRATRRRENPARRGRGRGTRARGGRETRGVRGERVTRSRAVPLPSRDPLFVPSRCVVRFRRQRLSRRTDGVRREHPRGADGEQTQRDDQTGTREGTSSAAHRTGRNGVIFDPSEPRVRSLFSSRGFPPIVPRGRTRA